MAADPPPPDLASVRAQMAVPSLDLELRGQKDGVGFAVTREQMDRAWEAALSPPRPAPPAPGAGAPAGVAPAAVISPHDDYVYAGRVYRAVLPRLAARTVIVIGVFHGYRKFGLRGRIVFDPYRAWRSPDGPVPVAPLREALMERLPAHAYVQDAAMHDHEHSIEALVPWLKRACPDVEIVPVLAPAGPWERVVELAALTRDALAGALAAHGLALGRDVAVAISADAIHYGPDFAQTRFGEGGREAYARAVEFDRGLLAGPLSGPVTVDKTYTLYKTYVDPGDPDTYRWTWCGRFSIPFGLLLFAGRTRAWPVAYETSLSAPELPLREVGLGVTAPATLEHWVGYPAVVITEEVR